MPSCSSHTLHRSIEELVTVGVVHEGVTLDSSVTLEMQAITLVMTPDHGKGQAPAYTEYK